MMDFNRIADYNVEIYLHKHAPTCLLRGTEVISGTIKNVDVTARTITISLLFLPNTSIVIQGWEIMDLKLSKPMEEPTLDQMTQTGNDLSSNYLPSHAQQQKRNAPNNNSLNILAQFSSTKHQSDSSMFSLPRPPSMRPPNIDTSNAAANLPLPPTLSQNTSAFVGSPSQDQQYHNTSTIPFNNSSHRDSPKSSSSGRSSNKKKKKSQYVNTDMQKWNGFDKSQEFDFEKNLSMFNKAQIFSKIRERIDSQDSS